MPIRPLPETRYANRELMELRQASTAKSLKSIKLTIGVTKEGGRLARRAGIDEP